jgi:hypothetical protein
LLDRLWDRIAKHCPVFVEMARSVERVVEPNASPLSPELAKRISAARDGARASEILGELAFY